MQPLRSARFRLGVFRRKWERYRAIVRSARSREEARELRRLSRIPSRRLTTTMIFGFPFRIPDAPTFLVQYDEIIQREHMKFVTDNPYPVIIDGGANAGVATVFFKRLYPQAQITAFEPDAQIASLLKANVASLCATNVDVVEAALWTSAGELTFWSQGGDAGRLGDEPPIGGAAVAVRSVRLADYLHQHVDLLKLDIEGAECEVLPDCEPLLGNVDRILLEYHSVVHSDQRLGEVLEVLRRSGFRYFIQAESGAVAVPPFVESHEWNGLDNQLLVAAERPRPK